MILYTIFCGIKYQYIDIVLLNLVDLVINELIVVLDLTISISDVAYHYRYIVRP